MIEEVVAYVNSAPHEGLGHWCVELQGKPIGWISLTPLQPTNRFQLAYRFAKAFRCNGYATEAAAAVLDYARDVLGLSECFDPVRVRQRFLSSFEAHNTRYIEVAGERIGFVVVKHHLKELLLDHLYVIPNAQGSGVGSAVLSQVFREADAAELPIRVGALKESASNRFYLRHGFQFVESGEFDNDYVRPWAPATSCAG